MHSKQLRLLIVCKQDDDLFPILYDCYEAAFVKRILSS